MVYGIDSYTGSADTCVTVGTFDGLHIGHRKIFETLSGIAHRENLRSVVITFDPHPRQVLAPGVDVSFVLTQREKVEAFRSMGIDCLIVHPFSRGFASLTAQQFLQDTLVNRLKMKHLVKGFNNHFGSDRLSDISAIRNIGGQAGFQVSEVSAEAADGMQASSTLVRNLIQDGQIAEANRILGYHFPISGTVQHGRMIGRTIDFPTANISVNDRSKIIPKPGAYAAVAMVDGDIYPTMLNIGSNPTVNSDSSKLTLEAHLVGYQGDLYDSELSLRVIRRLREERKFPSLDALKCQLMEDRDEVSAICRQEFPQIP